ncbi:MAG: 50S ribosomal protein L6 [Armatimonadetes bacterium]|nr:50S ribosomal protein L6 [Armatimonadota bacterium]
MSRIGKLPIQIPAGVKANIEGSQVTIEGPRGRLTRVLHPDMMVRAEGEQLLVERPGDDKNHRALHGLTRSLLHNMVEGVSKGYERVLEIQGVGYRATLNGKNLTLSVGFSHGIEVLARDGISFEVGQDAARNTLVTVRGIDKELVGSTAAQIRALRKPEPYKGKGIRYRGEVVKLKPGKSGKAGVKK